MTTRVQMTCISKKETKPYKDATVQHEIELEVPYDQNSIFYKMSGGTNIVLRTINPDAAAMFQLQGKYMLSIDEVDPLV